jgi:ABC-type multidrug transport system permease subunit
MQEKKKGVERNTCGFSIRERFILHFVHRQLTNCRLYHTSIDALSGIVLDLPIKFLISVGFNIPIYFLAGLRPEAAQFFVFFLFTFLARLTMVALFRTVGALTRTISQALAVAGVLVLIMVIYTGYVIPRPVMHPWFGWLFWINPMAYAFEALMVNQMHDIKYPCARRVIQI